MTIYRDTRVLVVREDESGHVEVSESTEFQTFEVEDCVHGGWVWGSDGPLEAPGAVGGIPSGEFFPAPGGSRFGVFEFAPHSAGKLVSVDHLPGQALDEDAGDPELHRTDTLAYEVIVSGRIDMEFPDGERVTLGPGDMLVLAGATHAWKNRYDEPCRFISAEFGLTRA